MDKLRRTSVIWRVGDQRPQGVATRPWHMPASRVDPVSDTRRQRFRPSLPPDDLIGARVGRKRVLKPGQDRAGGLHLLAIINAEKLALDHLLQAHRDLAGLHLNTAAG